MSSLLRLSLASVFCLLVCTSYGQNQIKADSIKELLDEGSVTGEEQLEAYFWLSAYSSSPFDELAYAKELLRQSEEAGNEEFLIRAYQRIGVAYRQTGNLEQALENLFKSANMASESNQFSDLLVDIYAEISTCYTQNGDSDNALTYGIKTVEMLRKTDRKQEFALGMLNLGYDLYLVGQYDSAMAYYDEAEQILQDIDMEVGLAYLTGNRALVYWKLGDTRKAINDLLVAVEVLNQYDDGYAISDYYNQLASIYRESDQWQEALNYATSSLELGLADGLKEQIRDAHFNLFKANYGLGSLEKAIEHQTLYHAYKDSIQNLSATRRLANLRTEFEVGRKQAKVDLLEEQRSNTRITMIGGGVILVILFGFLVLVYTYYRSRTKMNTRLKSALNERELLFKELHHRVKNNLQLINSLMFIKSAELNDQATLDFIDETSGRINSIAKIHESLLNSGSLSSLSTRVYMHELLDTLVDAYSHESRIKLDMEVEDVILEIDSLLKVGLVINELVSNIIKHAYPDGEEIKIIIRLYFEEKLHLIVADEGVGFVPGKENASFGTRIIELLLDDLKGSYTVSNELGTKFHFILGLKPENTGSGG